MTTATAMVLKAPRQFERRRFDVSAVGPKEGILRVEACGLCVTAGQRVAVEVFKSCGE